MTSKTLSARSVIASTLLGTVPPRLPGRLLLAFAEEFGIREGTTRTALSRMVDRGELARFDDGVYELAGDLLTRHHHQEAGLHPTVLPWDGTWELHVVQPGRRSSSDRVALRRACSRLGLWERRDGVWMRPANLAADRLPAARAVLDAQSDAFIASPATDPARLVTELFDHASWARRADELIVELEQTGPDVANQLADGFMLAASALRHLVTDPLLPSDAEPDGWPAARIRARYAEYLATYQAGLRAFFRTRLADDG